MAQIFHKKMIATNGTKIAVPRNMQINIAPLEFTYHNNQGAYITEFTNHNYFAANKYNSF